MLESKTHWIDFTCSTKSKEVFYKRTAENSSVKMKSGSAWQNG